MSQNKLTESNGYTIAFALIMSLLVAGALASMKQAWGPQQKANELLFNKTQILKSVMDVTPDTNVESIFDERVQGLILDYKGNITDQNTVAALEVDLKKEAKQGDEYRKYPLYVYTNTDGNEEYIIPMYGAGLWGWISAYFALDQDKNTIAGVSFDHETETPGLGAKIKDDPGFYNDFKGEKIFDDAGNLVGIKVQKGNNDPLNNDKTDHEIDAISGATITGDGVTEMIDTDLKEYEPFLKEKTN